MIRIFQQVLKIYGNKQLYFCLSGEAAHYFVQNLAQWQYIWNKDEGIKVLGLNQSGFLNDLSHILYHVMLATQGDAGGKIPILFLGPAPGQSTSYFLLVVKQMHVHSMFNMLGCMWQFCKFCVVVPFSPDPLSIGDDASGSGSGMCADDMCSRGPRRVAPVTDRTTLYAYPPENKKVKASANQNLPCITIYLLSLLTLLLRR